MTDLNAACPDLVFGFDAAINDTSLVVFHRRVDGTWQIEYTDGPDATELARHADQLFAAMAADAPEPRVKTPTRWGEWLEEMATSARFELTEWQRDVIQKAYAALIREGKLTHRGPTLS